MIVQPLRQLVQFGGGMVQRLGAIAPDIGNDLVVDVFGESSQIVFQMRRCFSQLLVPWTLWIFARHTRAPLHL